MSEPTRDLESSDSWTPCCGGELQGLVGRLRARRQSRRNAVAALGVVCLSLALGGVWSLRGGNNSTQPMADLPCRECLQQARDYLAGLLDQDVMVRMERHLARCPRCRDQVDQLRTTPQAKRSETRDDRTLALLTRVELRTW